MATIHSPNNNRIEVENVSAYAILIWFVAALFYSYEFFLRISPNVMEQDLMAFFNVNATQVGLLASSYFWPYLLLQIPVGMVLDRYSTRNILTLAALIVALGCVLFASTPHLEMAIVGRSLMGLGSAFAFVGCLKLSANWFPSRYFAIVVGLTNTLGVLGGISGQLPLAVFIETVGWRGAIWDAGIIGLILAACNYLILRDYPSDRKNYLQGRQIHSLRDILQGLKRIITSKQSWLVGIFGGMMVAPIIAFGEFWSDAFLQQAHHLTRVQAAGISSVLFIGIAVGGPVNGIISGLLGKRRPVMLMGVIGAFTAFSLLLFLTIDSIEIITGLLFVMGFFTSSMLLCFAINSESYPANITGIVIGFTNMAVMFFGGILFQPLIGKILDWQWTGAIENGVRIFTAQQYQVALSVFLGCHLIALLCLLFTRETRCCHEIATEG